MKHALKLVAVAGVLTVLAIGPAAADTTAQVTSLTTSLVTGGVKATGKASFAADPIVAVTDATGDGRVPGTDIAAVTVTPVSNKTTTFQIAIANAVPETGSIPAVTHWFWTFNIEGRQQQLHAMNTNYQDADPGAWHFEAQTCAVNPTTGVNECGGDVVEGSFADGVITWTLPNSSFGAADGGVISDGAIRATAGAAGVVWLNGGAAESDTTSHGSVEIPAATVELALQDAAGTVVSSTTVKPSGSGNYTATLPGAGSTVTARACFGVVCGDVVSAGV